MEVKAQLLSESSTTAGLCTATLAPVVASGATPVLYNEQGEVVGGVAAIVAAGGPQDAGCTWIPMD